MEIRFVGPLGRVTGSCTWMRDLVEGWNFLVDCGMQQGEYDEDTWNAGTRWPFDPLELKFVVLTHAHIDHSGLLPLLYRLGFDGEVWCSEETARIAEILLRDAARLPGSRYDEADVDRIRWRTPGGKTQLGGYHRLDQNLLMRFFRSGHIVGATSVTILWGKPKSGGQKSIVFSGDVGPGAEDREVLPFLRYPQNPAPATYAVLESTYGGVVRVAKSERNPEARRERLSRLLDRILETGGTLAIPAFSVGRTQDLMFDLHMVVANDPVRYRAIRFYMDSPTAMQVNGITLDALSRTQTDSRTGKVRPVWLGKQLFRDLGLQCNEPEHVDLVLEISRMTLSIDRAEADLAAACGNTIATRWRSIFSPVGNREALVREVTKGPRVVVMSSGSGDGGPAASWLPLVVRDERNIVAMSGHCGKGTIGNALSALESVPLDQRRLQAGSLTWRSPDGGTGNSVPLSEVQAQLCRLEGYSAHADQSDLVDWMFENHKGILKQSIAPTIFLQHGDDEQRGSLARALAKRADEWKLDVEVLLPDDASQWFDLDRGGASLRVAEKRKELEARIACLQNALATLTAE